MHRQGGLQPVLHRLMPLTEKQKERKEKKRKGYAGGRSYREPLHVNSGSPGRLTRFLDSVNNSYIVLLCGSIATMLQRHEAMYASVHQDNICMLLEEASLISMYSNAPSTAATQAA